MGNGGEKEKDISEANHLSTDRSSFPAVPSTPQEISAVAPQHLQELAANISVSVGGHLIILMVTCFSPGLLQGLQAELLEARSRNMFLAELVQQQQRWQ